MYEEVRFPCLVKLMTGLLTFPVSNADSERGFSIRPEAKFNPENFDFYDNKVQQLTLVLHVNIHGELFQNARKLPPKPPKIAAVSQPVLCLHFDDVFNISF